MTDPATANDFVYLLGAIARLRDDLLANYTKLVGDRVSQQRNRGQGYVDLLAAANRAISDALADGDKGGKHPPGARMAETIDNQLKHIEAHITQYQCDDRSENQLEHIVCRAAIAFALPSVIPTEAEGSRTVSGAQGSADASRSHPIEAESRREPGSQRLAARRDPSTPLGMTERKGGV